MQAAADGSSAAAVDLAEFLVEQGVPFRKAHSLVAGLVRDSLERHVDLAELVQTHPDLGDAGAKLLEPGVAVAGGPRRGAPGRSRWPSRSSVSPGASGSTGPGSVFSPARSSPARRARDPGERPAAGRCRSSCWPAIPGGGAPAAQHPACPGANGSPGSSRWRRTGGARTRRRTPTGVPPSATRPCSGRPGGCTCTSPTGCTGAPTSSAGPEGAAGAVLLRAGGARAGLDAMWRPRPAARRPRDLCSGPAKLCQALGLTGAFDGADLLRVTWGFDRSTRDRADRWTSQRAPGRDQRRPRSIHGGGGCGTIPICRSDGDPARPIEPPGSGRGRATTAMRLWPRPMYGEGRQVAQDPGDLKNDSGGARSARPSGGEGKPCWEPSSRRPAACPGARQSPRLRRKRPAPAPIFTARPHRDRAPGRGTHHRPRSPCSCCSGAGWWPRQTWSSRLVLYAFTGFGISVGFHRLADPPQLQGQPGAQDAVRRGRIDGPGGVGDQLGGHPSQAPHVR